MKAWLWLAPVLLMGAAARGDEADDTVSPDRPDFTNGTGIVAAGHPQVEGGYTYTRSGDDHSHSFGEILVRLAMSRKAELRLGVPTYIKQRGPGGNASGLSDAFIGTKVLLWPGGGRGLKKNATALLLGTTLPTGARALRSDSLQPQVALATDFDLSKSVSLSTNIGYARPDDGTKSFNQIFAGASFGFALSDKTGAFAELYGFNKTDSTGHSAKYADTGLSYLLSNSLQIDARVGFGLNNHTGGPDFFVGAGASKRF